MITNFRNSSVFSQTKQLTQMPVRYKRRGAAFRKRLGVYTYKIRRPQYYKNPHAMPLNKREALKKADTYNVQRIKQAERDSDRPFGKFTRQGNFKFDIDMVPFYNVPDLTGFKLKPYVPHTTPKIPEDAFEPRVIELPEHIKELKLGPEVLSPATPDEADISDRDKR